MQRIVALSAQNKRLGDELFELTAQNAALRARYNIGLPNISLFEHDPSEPSIRARYVADVHLFFDSYLKRKVEALVADVRQEAASVLNPMPTLNRAEFDWLMRGTENALWKVYEWAETLSGEHQQNIINKSEDTNN